MLLEVHVKLRVSATEGAWEQGAEWGIWTEGG
jgi:hypothetical protein